MAVSKPLQEPYLLCLLVTEICCVCLNPWQELEDYFYYVQLCNQGIKTLETRQVSTHIPLEEIPSVMRAIGFYPSEEEVGQLFLLLLLKEERARPIAIPKCSKGQILIIAMLHGSGIYLLAVNVFLSGLCQHSSGQNLAENS